jgi:hypothetical protein
MDQEKIEQLITDFAATGASFQEVMLYKLFLKHEVSNMVAGV